MDQDEKNLDLLALFHFILGPLTALGSLVFLIHVFVGISMLKGTLESGPNPPPEGFGWLFVIMGLLAIILGWTLGILMIIAGRKLKRRESRTFCIVIAAIECILTPLGTVLGVFTLITLTKASVIQLFAGSAGQESTELA